MVLSFVTMEKGILVNIENAYLPTRWQKFPSKSNRKNGQFLETLSRLSFINLTFDNNNIAQKLKRKKLLSKHKYCTLLTFSFWLKNQKNNPSKKQTKIMKKNNEEDLWKLKQESVSFIHYVITWCSLMASIRLSLYG